MSVLTRPALRMSVLTRPALRMSVLTRPALGMSVLTRPALGMSVLTRPALPADVGTIAGVTPSFNGLRVLTLESRRSSEMATLVANYDGQPISAPALREVPLDSHTDAIAFIAALLRHQFDLVVLLTGVGTRALLAVVDRRGARA